MVAKLKSSFLKSSFQLFCNKNLFNGNSNAQNDENFRKSRTSKKCFDSKLSNSSPNLSVNNCKHQMQQQQQQQQHLKISEIKSKKTNENNYVNSSQNSKIVSRSSSASGRVNNMRITTPPLQSDSENLNNNPIPVSDNSSNSTCSSISSTASTNSIASSSSANKKSSSIRSKSSVCQNGDRLNNYKIYTNENLVFDQSESNTNRNENRIHQYVNTDELFKSSDSTNSKLIKTSPSSSLSSASSNLPSANESGSASINNNNNKPNNYENLENNNLNNTSGNSNKSDMSSSSGCATTTSNLYKNNQSIASLKMAKRLQYIKQMETNFNSQQKQSQQQQQPQTQVIAPKSILNNAKKTNSIKNGDFFDYNFGHANNMFTSRAKTRHNTANRLSFTSNQTTSSNNNTNKKVVRFADALGLELESIITLNQMDSNLIKRRFKLNQTLNQNFNFYQNYVYNDDAFLIDQNKQIKNGYSEYIQQRNFYSENEALKYLDNTNDTANMKSHMSESPSIYDDIISQIAYGNCFEDKKKQKENLFSTTIEYSNEKSKLNSDVTIAPTSYYIQQIVSDSSANSNQIKNNFFLSKAKTASNARSTTNNTNSIMNSSNITIKTRINNGKLESEV